MIMDPNWLRVHGRYCEPLGVLTHNLNYGSWYCNPKSHIFLVPLFVEFVLSQMHKLLPFRGADKFHDDNIIPSVVLSPPAVESSCRSLPLASECPNFNPLLLLLSLFITSIANVSFLCKGMS